MFEDKRYNNDNLNKNRFFIPEDNTGLKAGNDNLSFDEERNYMPPLPPKPVEDKKSKKKFKGLAIGLVVVLVILVLGITGIGIMNLMVSPYKIYTTFFNEGYDYLATYLKESDAKRLNYNEEDSLVSSGSFNVSTDMEELKTFNEYNYDYKFSVNEKNKALDGNIVMKKGNNALFDLKSYLRDNKFYILESSVYPNLIEIGQQYGNLEEINFKSDYNDILNIVNSLKESFLKNLSEDYLKKEKTKVKIDGKSIKVTNNVLTLNKDEMEVLIKDLLEGLQEDVNALKSLSVITNISRKDLTNLLKELKNSEDLTVKVKEFKINILTEGLANNFVGFKVIVDKKEIISFLKKDNYAVLDIYMDTLALQIKDNGNKRDIIVKEDDVPIVNLELTKDGDKTDVTFLIALPGEKELEFNGTAKYELKRIGDKRLTLKLSGKMEVNADKEKHIFKLELNNMTQVGGKIQNIDVSKAKNIDDFEYADIKTIDNNLKRILYRSPLLNLYNDLFGETVENIFNCEKSYNCICNGTECNCKYLDKNKIEQDIVCEV